MSNNNTPSTIQANRHLSDGCCKERPIRAQLTVQRLAARSDVFHPVMEQSKTCVQDASINWNKKIAVLFWKESTVEGNQASRMEILPESESLLA